MVLCDLVESAEDLEVAMEIRRRVFVQELGVPVEKEQDWYDAQAVHVLARVDGDPVGTARMVVDADGGWGKIGRVAVLREYRGMGVGGALMGTLSVRAQALEIGELVLDAQVQVIPFYERLGFQAEGPVFLDAGIRHRRMRRTLPSR